MNLSRQEKLIVTLIASVFLLVVVVVVVGMAVYVLVGRSQPTGDAPGLVPTASVADAGATDDRQSTDDPSSENPLPPTNTPNPTAPSAPTETAIPATFTPPPAEPTAPPVDTAAADNSPTDSTGANGALGTYNNPVQVGSGFRFAGHGTMTVTEARWQSGQTGVAVVEISFTCERPADQPCDTGDFMFDAVGSSGVTYQQEYSGAVPEPPFGSFMNDEVYGGGTQTGYVGFLVTGSEEWLMMRVEIFLEIDRDPVFFTISR